jgi:putative intracellular protease/amidase
MSLKDPNPVNTKKPKRVAIVLSNPAVSTTTGWPVGFWWSELAHPYFAFTEKGYEVEIFSPDGGKCEADAMSDPRDPSGYSETDLISMGFIALPKHAALIENTRSVRDIDVAKFDAIVVAGGQGPMFTFAEAEGLQKKFVEFYEAGKIACALCHGVAILRYAKLSNGEYLAKGKTVTGFANVEEDFADNAVWSMNLLARDKHVMPWRIEDALKEIGANFIQAGLWRGFAVRDGNLITGQQNFSGSETAAMVVRALGELASRWVRPL